MISHDRLTELLSYEEDTGDFRWRVSRGKVFAGDIAGCVREETGYRLIGVDRTTYRASRLAWFFHFGRWPRGEIDHKNGRRDDNSISNLRDVTREQNAFNKKRQSKNALGYKGVQRSSATTFKVSVKVNRKSFYLGSFQSPEIAYGFYCAAAEMLHGEFARLS